MSRGNKSTKLKYAAGPDNLYNNRLIGKLINYLMRDGKKTVAEKQVYGAFDVIKKQFDDPVAVFRNAIKNVTPQMEVRSRRIGGAAYQVPVPVRDKRRTSLALRWLVIEARKRSSKEYRTFAEKLSSEIIDAYNKEGGAVRRKETAHRMAEANRAFSHFRW